MKNTLFENLKLWIPLALAITLLSGTIYLVAEQILRQSANDPQVQLAEDDAKELASGKQANTNVTNPININESLSTFVLVFDKDKKIVVSSASLDNATPELPNGVLDSAKTKGETRITWQPKKGLRFALVVKYFDGQNSGYVVVGRSIKEVETREGDLLRGVIVGWIVTLIITLLASLMVNRQKELLNISK
jgi:sensor histidine kinase regulating citrate/malate metabolism